MLAHLRSFFIIYILYHIITRFQEANALPCGKNYNDVSFTGPAYHILFEGFGHSCLILHFLANDGVCYRFDDLN